MTQFYERHEEAFALAEQIASKDLNNLFLTSRFFVDRSRYWAFCGLYALMRVVDDRIDQIPDRAGLSDEERRFEHSVVDSWQEALRAAVEGRSSSKPWAEACDFEKAQLLIDAASESQKIFHIPFDVWDNFFEAMHRDVDKPSFESYDSFVRYAVGASVAPTTIYLYLIAGSASEEVDGYRAPASFKIRDCGHHLGLFAYLAHILRDLPEDLAAGDHGLLYISEEDLASYGLDLDALQEDRKRGAARPALRKLLGDLAARSEEHLRAGKGLIDGVDGLLPTDCAFILALIVAIYEEVLAKIRAHSFDPMGQGHMLTMDEKQQIIAATAERTGYVPQMA